MNEHDLTETILTKEQVFQGHLIHVEHWQVALPNGEHALR